MSYILEALKKSEQERNRGRAPDLRALHEAGPAPVTESSRQPYMLVTVVVLGAIALVAWWQPWASRPVPAITITPPHTQVPRPVVAPPSAPVPVQTVLPAPVASASIAQVTPATELGPSAPPVSRILAYSELPLEIRRGIPEMTFDVHLYSAKPAERMVSINGKMMQEGQEVSPGLKLQEIVQDGMVFSYQGYRFKRGVF